MAYPSPMPNTIELGYGIQKLIDEGELSLEEYKKIAQQFGMNVTLKK